MLIYFRSITEGQAISWRLPSQLYAKARHQENIEGSDQDFNPAASKDLFQLAESQFFEVYFLG